MSDSKTTKTQCRECVGTGYAEAAPGFTFGNDCLVCKGEGWLQIPNVPPQTTTTQRWAVDHDDRPGMEWNRHIVVEDNPDHRICFMAHSGGRDPEQDEANANMVAAAPELLASLQEIVSEWGFPNTPKWHRARDALDKAEGRKGAR